MGFAGDGHRRIQANRRLYRKRGYFRSEAVQKRLSFSDPKEERKIQLLDAKEASCQAQTAYGGRQEKFQQRLVGLVVLLLIVVPLGVGLLAFFGVCF